MTIYWERCGVCGRHYPTKTCWLNPELPVCMHCCFICPLRSQCPSPVWLPELKHAEIAVPVEKPVESRVEAEAATPTEARPREARAERRAATLEERKRKIRQLEELLKRLEGG